MNNKLKLTLSLVLALVMVIGGVASAAEMLFYDVTTGRSYNEPLTNAEIEELVAAFEADHELAKMVDGKLVNYNDYRAAVVQVLVDALEDGKTEEEALAILVDELPAIIAALDEVVPEEPPVVAEKWFISLDTTAVDDTIIADGDDNTTVIIKIVDEDGEVQPVNGIVIELSTSHGSLGSSGQKTRVTLQNGRGTMKLNSEFSADPITAELTAKLYEASLEYQELIGTKEFIFNVFFKPLDGEVYVAPPVLVAAESNQADRVTLFFDKDVDIEKFERAIAAESEEEWFAIDPAIGVFVEQNNEEFDVIGYLPVPGNSKALVAILEVDANDETVLTDNEWVEVWTFTSSDYGNTENMVEFLLTDARKPEFTEVIADEDSMKMIRLKFSESISTIGAITIDGGIVDVNYWVIDDYDLADWDEDDNFTPFKDYRSFVDVYIDGFLTAGEHSVTVTKAADWAGLTDPKNVSTTQTLEFEIKGSDDLPKWTVVVESPEQIRITFPDNVEFVDEAYGENWWLEYEDGDTWIPVEEGMISTFENTPEGTQIVLETIRDWTDYFNTDGTEDNYYNFPMRLHADEEVLRNTNNGKENEEINFDLNYAGSPLNNEDVRSPKNLDVIQEDEYVYNFDIVMDEPVKGRNIPITDDNNLGATTEPNTPSQEQVETPVIVVEFIGKNSEGTVVTIPGVVNGYGDDYSKDMVINVGEGTTSSLQALVDDDDYETTWTLNVKNITDDVGNAAETVVWEFEVPKTVDEEDPDLAEFWVEDAWFDEYEDDNGDSHNAIYVDFTDFISVTGDERSAINLANYSVSNQDWPSGTYIAVNMDTEETDDDDEVLGYYGIIIVLGDGFFEPESAESYTLEVAKTLKSKDGKDLLGFLEYPKYTRYQEVIRFMTP